MPIETNNLVLYKSEGLADTEDGGGKYSGQVIIDGQSNNLFDDISEMDRTMGDVSMRKIFPAVTTNDTDKLMGATVFISQNPKDPNVSAPLFSTKDWNDQRKSAQIAKIIIDGKEFEYKLARYSINDPLDIDYVGLSVKQWYTGHCCIKLYLKASSTV